ncbi:MAG: hypothetical protein IJ218_03620 [Alphaproteobacteria bacterium]|nr:hypothetical protein [Alphaproteobacteria bacterium]
MNLNQYAIFHKHGRLLDAAAIAYMLFYGSQDMAELIFCYEPNYGILNKNIEFILGKHEYLRPLLEKVKAEKRNKQKIQTTENTSK